MNDKTTVVKGAWPKGLRPATIHVEPTKGTIAFKDRFGATIGYGELFVGESTP